MQNHLSGQLTVFVFLFFSLQLHTALFSVFWDFFVLLCDLKISATFLSGDKKNGDFEDDAAMRVFKSGSVLFRLWVRVSQIIPTNFMCLY